MKKPLQTILVDDEEYCRRDLTELLRENPLVKVVGEAAHAKDAIRLIDQINPDLVFLDLNLADINGFKVLAKIQREPAVIAVTAFSNYAVEGFTMNLADYILKPVDEIRLQRALLRARDQILLRSLRQNPLIQIEINGHQTQLGLSDIFWVKSNENYVEVCSTQGKGLIRSTFNNFRSYLPAGFTLEISRGHIIAAHQIKTWKRNPKGPLQVILKCGAVFNVSKRLQKDVLEQLELLN